MFSWAGLLLTALTAGCEFRDDHFPGPLGTPLLTVCRSSWLFQLWHDYGSEGELRK